MENITIKRALITEDTMRKDDYAIVLHDEIYRNLCKIDSLSKSDPAVVDSMWHLFDDSISLLYGLKQRSLDLHEIKEQNITASKSIM